MQPSNKPPKFRFKLSRWLDVGAEGTIAIIAAVVTIIAVVYMLKR